MKYRSHTCGTWYALLHSPRKFRLSKMQWGNLFNRSKPETSREQGALWLKCQNHKFDHFYQYQLLGLIRTALFESVPSKCRDLQNVRVCFLGTCTTPYPN